MFIWNVEEMELLKLPYESYKFDDWGNPIYPFEKRISEKDKIDFVDSMNDGVLLKLLSDKKKFEAEEQTIKTDIWGDYEKVSLNAWFKRNKISYLVDFYNVQIPILSKDFVDTLFRAQLEQCRKLEREYFYQNTEEGQLITEIWNRNVALGGDPFWGGNLSEHIELSVFGHLRERKILYSTPDRKETRKLTVEELKMVKDALVSIEEKYVYMLKAQEEYKKTKLTVFDKLEGQINF